MRKKIKSEDKLLWICGAVFLCIFLISGFLLLNYYLETKKQERMNEELSKLKHGYDLEYFTIVEGVPIEPASGTIQGSDGADNQNRGDSTATSQKEEAQKIPKLSDINADYVFWLEIPDSSIDYPVVQKDNEYYLKRDFYGDKNNHGTIFLDESCDADGTFLLLHGHNMKDGTMFGGLREFKKADYRNKHTVLYISGNQGEEKYRIFAAASVDLYNANRFKFEEFPQTEQEIEKYLANIKKHSFWCDSFEWESGKKLVLLSTCDYETEEQRLVIFAIKE